MASRRDLKRDISYVIGDIFTECRIYKELVPGTDKAAAEKLITIALLSRIFRNRFQKSLTS